MLGGPHNLKWTSGDAPKAYRFFAKVIEAPLDEFLEACNIEWPANVSLWVHESMDPPVSDAAWDAALFHYHMTPIQGGF